MRGSNLLPNDIISRYGAWGIPVGILIGFSTQNIMYGMASIILAGIGASLGYIGNFNLIASANRTLKNYFLLTISAMYRFFPLFFASIFVGLQWKILPGILAGITFVPAYFLGIKISPKLTLPLLTVPSEWGEFFFWGSIYLALGIGLSI